MSKKPYFTIYRITFIALMAAVIFYAIRGAMLP